jgi:fructokinase
MIYGGIEAGGTKWVCATGGATARAIDVTSFPTTTPDETIARAAAFFAQRAPLAAIGVGSFGPLDLDRASPTWGYITTTPKEGWAYTPLARSLGDALGVPVVVDTDVNAAALGEWCWGSAAGLHTFCYVTVGTGIGGGVIANGELVHGLAHPEMGHMRVPHDVERDPFAGACPYHGDCLEGLASGEAIRARWGRPGAELTDPAVWELEAHYLALAFANIVCALSPQRIVVGGGVAAQPRLLPLVRERLHELLGGYFASPALADAGALGRFIVAPGLGELAGVLGAIRLAAIEAGAR